jgi:hypothetical protein
MCICCAGGAHLSGARGGAELGQNPQNGAAGAPFQRTHSGECCSSIGGTLEGWWNVYFEVLEVRV